MDDALKKRIDELVNDHDVVLFMKGSTKLPQCGFSGVAVAVLERCGVTDIHDINILLDQELRQGIKDYSQWPTIPQLYVKGEFIGGSDIMRDMYESGEMQTMLAEKGVVDTAA